MKRTNKLKHLALAMGFTMGLGAISAHAQATIDVGGAGTIGDSTLTSGSIPTLEGATWSTPGAAAGGGNTSETFLSSPDIVVGATGSTTLTFTHRYFFESGWDGGAVFVSVNGAAATYVPLADIISGTTYDGTTGANPGTAWTGGEDVFFGKSSNYDNTASSNLDTTVMDLGSLSAGDTVSVEFRAIWDEGYFEPDTNWEIATVKVTNFAASDILDVDFLADGASSFAVTSNANINGGEWTYPKATNKFEINADTLAEDRYAPNVVGSAIDLNDANISVSLLTGTLDPGDSFQLFDLSGGTTLTGSVALLSLPPGQWDSSTFETDGTITCLDPASPLIYEPFADLDTNLDNNTPGAGLPGLWESSPNSSVAPESLLYGGLLTSGGRMTASTGSNFQRSEVSSQTLFDEGLMDDGATVWFSVLMTKHPVGSNSNRRTYFSLGTGPPDGFDRIRTGPDSANNGRGFTVVVNKVGNTGVTAQSWGNGGGEGPAQRGATDLSVADGDTFLAVGKITWGQFGTTDDQFDLYLPSKDLTLGSVVSTISGDFDQLGTTIAADKFAWIGIGGGRKDNNAPQLDEIRFGATSTDVLPLDLSGPVLVSTDPVDDSPNGNGTVQIATFNEEVIAGSGDIRIVNDTDAITSTIAVTSSQVVFSGNTVTINQTVPLLGGKSYHIEIDAGAVTNYAAVDYAGIADSTTWNFTADGTPPTVASITDDTSPLPLLVNTSLTYTVTFDEPIDAGTVGTGDFGNGGSASITVDSVTATANPAVFEVGVTADSTGTLTLEIALGAVITDLTGNALVTTSAIPDDTTINVNNPAPSAASMLVDFQGTISSQLNANMGGGEGRWFHVSVNPANAGTGWYCADIPNSSTDGPPGFRAYTGPVVAYKFLGGTNDSVAGVTGSGGDAGRITYATDDLSFDGFGQQQLRLWTTNDPGSTFATTFGTAATGFASIGNFGYRDWQGATGTVDISGIASGSIHIYYGAYNSTPSVQVTLKDSNNVHADIVLNDAHSIADGGTGDAANNGEYYVAEVDFVTEGDYDVIEYYWFSSNGRGLGTVLTGPDVVTSTPYSEWAATNGLTEGVNDGQGDDADNGSLNNLGEFGLGGDPLNANDDGSLLHAFSDEVVGGGAEEGILTILVRTGATFGAVGNNQVSAPVDGIVYTVAGDSTLPVAGGSAVTGLAPVVTTGLPAAPFGYEYASFYISGAEGYFQVTVAPE